jgi:hypothetical protein
VTGFEKWSLLDFNYKVEPLPGKFPFPGLGPFDLLGVSFSNCIALDDLEQKGIFRINSAILTMYAKIAAAYTPEDVEVIGDGFVRMHGVVKKFADPVVIQSLEAVVDMYAKLASAYTPEDIDAMGGGFVRMHGIIKKFSEPGFIQFLEKFMEVPARVNLDDTRQVGPLGLFWKMRGAEAKEGLGVLVELTKALGNLKGAAPEPQQS